MSGGKDAESKIKEKLKANLKSYMESDFSL